MVRALLGKHCLMQLLILIGVHYRQKQISSFYSAFSLFGVGTSSFQSPRSPVVCFFYLYSFYLSSLITSLHLSFGLPIFRCPPIFHVLITTSSSVILSTRPNHLGILFSHQCLPHPPLLLFLLLWSFQSSLFQSSISTFSILFFLASSARSFSVPRPHFHTLEQRSYLHG